MRPAPFACFGHEDRRVRAALFAFVLLAFALPIYAHGDWMEQHRFLSFALPVVTAAGYLGASGFPVVLTRRFGNVGRGIGRAAGALAALFVAWPVTTDAATRATEATLHTTLEARRVEERSRYFESFAERQSP